MENRANRVLIADDEQDILEIISYNLGREGYEIYTAKDGPRPAFSHPQPASLNARKRAATLIALPGSPPIRPPCEPVTTTRPRSLASISEAESMQITRSAAQETSFRCSRTAWTCPCPGARRDSRRNASIHASPGTIPAARATAFAWLTMPRRAMSPASPMRALRWLIVTTATENRSPSSRAAMPAPRRPPPASLRTYARGGTPSPLKAEYRPP